jgi:hypothetical protein
VTDSHRLDPGGVDRSRVKWRVIGALGLVVAVAAVVIATLTAVKHGDDDGVPLAGGGPTPTRSASSLPDPVPSEGPEPPADGSWVGAVVQTSDFTKRGEIKAITDWEALMGRRMDLVHTYHTWDNAFPDQVDRWAVANDRELLLSWGGTDTRVIQTGQYDDLIRQRARDVKKWGAPILLQWRWEMDRPNLQTQIWGPEDYIAAWKHIRSIFTEEKVTNASWVWCPTADGFTDGRAQAYYPGDEQVDWTCADVYPGEDDADFGTVAKAFLEWAKDHPKPIVIGEYGAYGGYPGGQAAWLKQAAEVAKANPEIKGMVYFDWNDENNRPKTQLSLRPYPDAVAAYRSFVAESYFNPRSLPVKQ